MYYLIFVMVIGLFGSWLPSNSEGNYKSWTFSDTRVIGRLEIEDAGGVKYCNISKLSRELTKIKEYNPNGILKREVNVHFKEGRLSSITYLNPHGFPFAFQSFEKKGDGKLLETIKNCGQNTNLPCKGKLHKYKKGLITESFYVGFDEKPCVCTSGRSMVKYKRYTDKHRWGMIQEEAYFNKQGEAVVSLDYHLVKYQRDLRGNIVNESYWGINDNPAKTRFGFHEIRRKYDKKDKLKEVAFYSLSGVPISNIYGSSKLLYEYEEGNFSKITRLNIKGHVAKESELKLNDGAAIIKYTYDDKGNMLNVSYFDKSEVPMISNMGYHIVQYHYDKNNNANEEMYFGINGNPVIDKWGKHKKINQYNDLGFVMGHAAFDMQNISTEYDSSYIFINKFEYNDEGRPKAMSFWNNENSKITSSTKVHKHEIIFNEIGLKKRTIFFDGDGNLTASTLGVSRIEYKYDERSRIISRWMFDAEKPVMVKRPAQISNYHKIIYVYDGQNRINEIKYFDKELNPVNSIVNGGEEVHNIQFEYKGNNVVRQNWFKINSMIPYKIVDCTEDKCITENGGNIDYLNPISKTFGISSNDKLNLNFIW